MKERPEVIYSLDVEPKGPVRQSEAPIGVSACYEPRTEPGPLRTTLEASSSPLPQDPETRAWARGRIQNEPTLLVMAEQLGGRKRARAYMDLSLCHFIVGDLDKGRDFAERAILMWAELGDGVMEVECMLRAGRYHVAAGEHQRAAAYYERASEHPTEMLQPIARYNIAISACELFVHLQHFDRALPVLTTAVSAARALAVPDQLLTALFALMICQHRLSNFTEAAAAGEEVMALCQRVGDRDMQDNIRAMLGAVYEDSGRPNKAAALQRDMVDRGHAEGVPRTVMIERLVHAAQAHMNVADFRSAAALFQQALPLIRAEGTQDLAEVVASNLAFVTVRAGDLEGGKALFEDAVRHSSEESRPLLRMAQGDALKEAGDHPAAAVAYREALAAFRKRGDKTRVGELLQRLGDVVCGVDRGEALRLYREWLRDHTEGQSQEWVWGMLQRAGLLANVLQGGDAAMPYFRRMKTIADALGDTSLQARSLHRQALAHARKGDMHSARALTVKAHAMLKSAGLHSEAEALAVELASIRGAAGRG